MSNLKICFSYLHQSTWPVQKALRKRVDSPTYQTTWSWIPQLASTHSPHSKWPTLGLLVRYQQHPLQKHYVVLLSTWHQKSYDTRSTAQRQICGPSVPCSTRWVTGRPPFRAANHVELLRKIEKGLDQIKFPEDVRMSTDIKLLIRSLLKRSPVERLSFEDFFSNPAIYGDIPGLASEDRPKQPREKNGANDGTSLSKRPNLSRESRTQLDSPRRSSPMRVQSDVRNPSDTRSKRQSMGRKSVDVDDINENYVDALEKIPQDARPGIRHTATAPPGRHRPDPTLMQRTSSRDKPRPANSPNLREQRSRRASGTKERLPSEEYAAQKVARLSIEEQEKAAQEVAFERDYVLVEKKTVEVNALADELAASPQIHGNTQGQGNVHHGIVTRRNTTQGVFTVGTPFSNTRAVIPTKRPEHLRTTSYERRIRTASTSSAISKAINLASGRLFSLGMSPPLSMGRTGPSPPLYNAFPAYPVNSGSVLLLGDGSKNAIPLDEDGKTVNAIEDSAHKSNVVYNFAEVKYKQLIPLAPSMDHGLGLQEVGIPKDGGSVDDGGLTVDAVVTISEEALVLYVKSLSLLAQSINIAAAWWARKTKNETVEDSPPSRSPSGSHGSNFILRQPCQQRCPMGPKPFQRGPREDRVRPSEAHRRAKTSPYGSS